MQVYSSFPKDLVVLPRAAPSPTQSDAPRAAAAHVAMVCLGATVAAKCACALPSSMNVPDLLSAAVLDGGPFAAVACTTVSGAGPTVVLVGPDRARRTLHRLAGVACPALAVPIVHPEPNAGCSMRVAKPEEARNPNAFRIDAKARVVGMRLCGHADRNATLVIAVAAEPPSERADATLAAPSIFRARPSSPFSKELAVRLETVELDAPDAAAPAPPSVTARASEATRLLAASAGVSLTSETAAFVASAGLLAVGGAFACSAWFLAARWYRRARRVVLP